MKPTPTDPIEMEIERALQQLSDQGRQDLAARIRPILYTNRDKGRIARYLDGTLTYIQEYVFRVAENYESQNIYLEKIKIERSTEVWEPLFAEMQKWAYYHLKRKDFNGTLATQENATDCATEAAILLLKAHFPYDTDFKPWAHVIVQNACQKFIQNRFKKTQPIEDDQFNLEDLLEHLQDHRSPEDRLQRELGADLRNAMLGLSEARQRVIEDMYFSGLTVGEISQKMGKSAGAIHSLHFNALIDLQKILSRNRDISNE